MLTIPMSPASPPVMMSRIYTPRMTINAESVHSNTSSPNHVSTRGRYTSQLSKRDEELLDLAYEDAGHFIGPMPPKHLLDEFMPLSSESPIPDIPPELFHPVTNVKFEKNMHQQFIEATEMFASPFRFVNVSQHKDPSCDNMAHDISMYDNGESRGQVMDFSTIAVAAKFRPRMCDDPFRDNVGSPDAPNRKKRKHESEDVSPDANSQKKPRNAKSFEKKSNASKLITVQKMTQCHTHKFSLPICGRSARFIRWDPSGYIVSSAFDYHRVPLLLAEFLWRFDKFPLEGNGYDITVSEPTNEETAKARDALVYFLDPPALTSFIKLKVSNEGDDTISKYIAPRTKYRFHSPIGRGSRVFPAYDVTDDNVVYVKDQWRQDEPGMESEREIYVELYKHDVQHLPRLDRGSDVLEHATITKRLLDTPWVNFVGVEREKVINYKYHRLVFRDIGRDLRNFSSTGELVNVIADATEAHWDAFKKAGILHRDISVGNILASKTGEGLLIDWELSACNESPKLCERAGTCQFMSAAVLLENNVLHRLQDDLESFFWVFIWTSLKYTDHNLSPYRLNYFLECFDDFDELIPSVERDGGIRKRDTLLACSIQEAVKFTSQPLNALVRSLAPVLASRYSIESFDDDLEEAMALYFELGGEEGASKDERFRNMIPHQYFLHTKRLEDPTWIIKTMKTLLDSGDWPANDQAKRQNSNVPTEPFFRRHRFFS